MVATTAELAANVKSSEAKVKAGEVAGGGQKRAEEGHRKQPKAGEEVGWESVGRWDVKWVRARGRDSRGQ